MDEGCFHSNVLPLTFAISYIGNAAILVANMECWLSILIRWNVPSYSRWGMQVFQSVLVCAHFSLCIMYSLIKHPTSAGREWKYLVVQNYRSLIYQCLVFPLPVYISCLHFLHTRGFTGLRDSIEYMEAKELALTLAELPLNRPVRNDIKAKPLTVMER